MTALQKSMIMIGAFCEGPILHIIPFKNKQVQLRGKEFGIGYSRSSCVKGDQCHNSKPFSGRRFIFCMLFLLLTLFFDSFCSVATFLSLFSDAALFLRSLLFCRYF